MSGEDLWGWWPDDFMCPIGEGECYLSPPLARSDDYLTVVVEAYDEAGSPSRWSPKGSTK